MSLKNESGGDGAVCPGIKRAERGGRRMRERRSSAAGCPRQAQRLISDRHTQRRPSRRL